MRAHFGSFDAERSWEEPGFARLPALPSPLPDDAIVAMDELLVGACEGGDVAVTARPLLDEHRGHLLCAGLPAKTADKLTDVMTTHQLAPWAVTPEVIAMWRELGVPEPLPQLEVVRRVNSKLWSTKLRDRLGLAGGAFIVRSAAELGAAGAKYPAGVVVKEPYGVSGRGSVHASPQRLERLVAAIAREEVRGLSVAFVVEPFLRKRFDFSAQLTISANEVSLDSVGGMVNRGFAYAASCPLTEAESGLLAANRYEETAMQIGRAVAAEGYVGPICIDGMALEDGTLVPLLEINARGSLGRIQSQLDRTLMQRGSRAWLTAIRLVSERPIAFTEVHKRLDDAELLLDERRAVGLILLTARTLPFGAAASSGGPRAGRLFTAVAHRRAEEVPAMLARATKVLESLGYHVLG